MSRALRFLPLALFAIFVIAVGWRIANPPDQVVTSKLAGQPVPAFTLGAILPGKPGLASSDLATGGPRLVNIFASWCVPCITEVGVLKQLQGEGVHIDGIAVRDRTEDIAAFLARNGDPFERIGDDPRSQVQLAMGSSGVPESFIVDGRGIIRHQHIGPIMEADMPRIRAELEKAR